MHRGSNLSEGVQLVERSAAGVTTTFSFEGGELIVIRNQDLEPDLKEVQAMRERNALRKFASDIKEIGRIPELYYSKICTIMDPAERKRAVRRFFVEHPEFCAYAPYLANSRRPVVQAQQPSKASILGIETLAIEVAKG